MDKLRKGQRVRFITEGQLGASERDQLHRVVDDEYTKGDEGIVSFPHPNQKACKGWWYVEVDSKSEPQRKLYVGVVPRMVEVIS